MRLRNGLAAGLVGLAIVATACGGAAENPDTPSAQPAESPTPTPEPVYQDVADLVPGDCFDPISDSDDPDFLLAGELRACDEPHLMEAFATVTLDDPPDAPYPGDAEVFSRSEEECLASFQEYVGTDYEDSALFAFIYYPSPETWSGGDRAVLCVIEATTSAPLTRSVEGSKE